MPKRTWRGGPESVAFARRLRREMTDAERKLWSALRDRQVLGRTFRRQYPAAGFYLDFVSLDDKLIVEVMAPSTWIQRTTRAAGPCSCDADSESCASGITTS
jgi:hypothetical protein